MIYNHTIDLEVKSYYIRLNVIIWCFKNLSYGEDFAYSDETDDIDGIIIAYPHWLWLAKKEDMLAIRLRFNI